MQATVKVRLYLRISLCSLVEARIKAKHPIVFEKNLQSEVQLDSNLSPCPHRLFAAGWVNFLSNLKFSPN